MAPLLVMEEASINLETPVFTYSILMQFSKGDELLSKHENKAVVFPVVMYGCESWTIKKADRRRIDAFELWCWRRLLRVPWTARRSNQSILKEISPRCSLEGLMAEAEAPILWPPHEKS